MLIYKFFGNLLYLEKRFKKRQIVKYESSSEEEEEEDDLDISLFENNNVNREIDSHPSSNGKHSSNTSCHDSIDKSLDENNEDYDYLREVLNSTQVSEATSQDSVNDEIRNYSYYEELWLNHSAPDPPIQVMSFFLS